MGLTAPCVSTASAHSLKSTIWLKQCQCAKVRCCFACFNHWVNITTSAASHAAHTNRIVVRRMSFAVQQQPRVNYTLPDWLFTLPPELVELKQLARDIVNRECIPIQSEIPCRTTPSGREAEARAGSASKPSSTGPSSRRTGIGWLQSPNPAVCRRPRCRRSMAVAGMGILGEPAWPRGSIGTFVPLPHRQRGQRAVLLQRRTEGALPLSSDAWREVGLLCANRARRRLRSGRDEHTRGARWPILGDQRRQDVHLGRRYR